MPIRPPGATGGISVNLDSRNYSFTAPLLALPGRAGLNLSLGMTYNSRVWNGLAFNQDKGFPGPGWRLLGAIQGRALNNAIAAYTGSVTGKQSFLYLAPDGTRHELALNTSTGLYESYDSSYLDFNATTKVLRTTDGTKVTFAEAVTANGDYQFLPTEIKDRNGNYITIVYKTLSNNDRVVDYLLDTLARRIDFYYESNRLREIRQDRGGVVFRHALIDYEPVTLSISGGYTTDPPNLTGQQVYLPTRITYPTGMNFRFYYTSYAQIYRIEKWVPSIQGQGAARSVANTQFNLPSAGQASWPASGVSPTSDTGMTWHYGSPAFSSRSDGAENQAGASVQYQYSIQTTGSGAYSKYHLIWHYAPEITEYRLYHGQTLARAVMLVANSTTLKTQEATWTSDSGLSYTANARMTQTKIIDPNGPTKTISYSYTQDNGVWLVSSVTEPFRRTDTTYTSYPTQRIIGLPSQVSVYDATGATLLARTSSTYDQTGTFTDSNGQAAAFLTDETSAQVVQHDNTNYNGSFTQRGQLTTVTQHGVLNGSVTGNTRVTARTGYDTNGNVRWGADAAGNRAQTLYTDNFLNKPGTVGNTQAYVYTAADPTGLRKGSQYDYWTGLLLKSFILKSGSSTEEQIVTTSYDFADRPLQTTKPDGGWVKSGYWDNLLGTTSFARIDTVSGQDHVAFSFSFADGAGRTLRKGSDHPSAVAGKYSGQKFVYNARGEQTDASNVTAMDADWTPIDEDASSGWLFINHVYDGQGRLLEVTNTDGTQRQYDYLGCGCAGSATVTAMDERGCRVKTETDAAGRLWKSSELNAGSETAYNTATYTYDPLDRITQIRVDYYNYPNGYAEQLRTFVFDEYGRLQSETAPEAGTVTYAYTANDQALTKTDARGKTVTYTYNTRNLVTGMSYNDSGATPAVSYGYDEYGARTTMTDGAGTMTYHYNSYRQLDYEERTFTALQGKYYKLSYGYNLAGQLKTVNYSAATSASALPAAETEERIAAVREPGRMVPGAAMIADTDGLTAVGAFSRSGAFTAQRESLFSLLRYSRESVAFASRLLTDRAMWAAKPNESSAATNTYTINGAVRTAQGQGIAGATVTAEWAGGESGPFQITTTTGAFGDYALADLPEGATYHVSASKQGYAITPSYQEFYIVRDEWDVNFTATQTAFTIAGTVTDGLGQPVSGVTMTLSGGQSQTKTTDGYGNYFFTSVPGGSSYTLTPAKNGYNFTPAARSYTNLSANQSSQNFTAAPAPPPPPPSGPQTWSYNVNYAHNAVGALSGVGTNLTGTDPNATSNVISSLSYNGFGGTTAVNYGNGRRLTLGYSVNRHQMTSMKVDNQNGTDAIIHKTYSYAVDPGNPVDNDGRIKKISDLLDANYTTTYTYDEFNRLSSATAAAFTRSYWYDPVGNIRSIQHGFGAPAQSYSYPTNASGAPATNRMSSVTVGSTQISYGWDAAGNMTSEGGMTFSYDAAGRLKETGSGGQNVYGYDGNSARVKKTEGGTTLYYVRSSVLGQAVMEVGGTATLNRGYVYAGGQVVAQRSNDGGFYWQHANHLGSVHKLTDANGAVVYRGEFDPHGQPLLETGGAGLANRKYTGYERDLSGQDYANARMFLGSRGRFTSPDPAGLSSTAKSIPQSLNRYSYVDNDPVNQIDPSGNDGFDAAFYQFFLAGTCGGRGGVLGLLKPDGYGFLPGGGVGRIPGLAAVFCESRPSGRELFTRAVLEELGDWQRPSVLICKVELRARKIFIAGVQIPGYHSYVVLIEKDLGYDDNREYFFQGLHTGDKLEANSGAYNLTNAGSDYEVAPKILDGIVLRGSCLKYARAFDYVANRINDLDFDYDVSQASSNSAAYTALVYAGLPADALGDTIKRQIGFDIQLPGWGVYLPGVH